jgi:hypothetical protein
MRKRLTLIIALGAAIALSVAAMAFAEKPTVVEVGNLVLTLNGGVKPTALPKNKFAPITLNVEGGIATKNGAQPPALKEAVILTDKNGTINAKGLATCTSNKLQAENTQQAKKACPKAIVGEGRTTVRVEFPESLPFSATGPLVAFNGGEKGGVTTLYIQAYVSVPTPTALVTTIKIKKVHKGPYGLESVASIPVIVGGSGSVTNFSLKIHKTFTYKGKTQSYLEAKCANGHFLAKADAIFTGGTSIEGNVDRTCKAKG